MEKRTSALMVLNYNGRPLLERYLPSIVRAAKEKGASHRVIVIDNASTDDSLVFLRSSFPEVEIAPMKANLLMFAYNSVITHVPEEHVILLNNDIEVDKNFVAPLLRHFDDPNVFAVGCNMTSPRDSHYNYNTRRVPVLGGGLLETRPQGDGKAPALTTYGVMGASAVSKSKFLALGGLDTLYRPFYYDDVDVCYRAWMVGWKVVFEPESVVQHEGAATIGTMVNRQRMNERGGHLFVWKNVTDPKWLATYVKYALIRPPQAVIKRDNTHLLPLLDALPRWQEALAKRRKVAKTRKRSDAEIFGIIRENSL